MAKSTHDILDEVKENYEAEDMFDVIQEAASKIDAIDDVLRATIETNNQFTGDEFDNSKIQELREHIEYIASQLEEIQTALY